MDTHTIRIPIFGLTCGAGGMAAVERELARVPGVVDAYGNPATEAAYVTYDPAVVGVAELRRAIERAGYRPGSLAGT
jgi:P-type Cu+ transporter